MLLEGLFFLFQVSNKIASKFKVELVSPWLGLVDFGGTEVVSKKMTAEEETDSKQKEQRVLLFPTTSNNMDQIYGMNYVILQHVSANEGKMSDFGFPRANEEWKTRGRKTIT
jgi:hypothetical protein